jgi:hypothetical protein
MSGGHSADAIGFGLPLGAAGAILAAVVLLTVATLLLCGGHLFYALDDPYITLALSGHIASGHYGINFGEGASPSSSILYPFLLAVFAWIPWQPWVPLLINSAAAAATAALLAAICVRYSIGVRPENQRGTVFLIVSLCFAINIVGLVFTGLEHSLHILTSVAVVYGLALTLEEDAVPGWLIPVLILNPLWRFEGAALTCLTLLALALAGHVRAAIVGLLLTSAALGAYMVLMASLGLPLLPSSVLVKATVFTPGDSAWGRMLHLVRHGFSDTLYYSPRVVLLWTSLALLVVHPLLRARRRIAALGSHQLPWARELLLAAVVAGTALAHSIFGSWGGWFRYETYLLAIVTVATVVVWHSEIERFVRRAGPRSIGLVAAVILCLGVFYLRGTLVSPLAARSIYEQQYQMHRFAVDFYRRPVAVNDLGWVSYRNPNYVLDVWGLGSEAARRARLVNHAPGWMAQLASAHHVGLAIIYPSWFGNDIPKTWRAIAVLRMAHPRVSVAAEEVTFYATSTEAEGNARAALSRFASTVPSTVAQVVFTPDSIVSRSKTVEVSPGVARR